MVDITFAITFALSGKITKNNVAAVKIVIITVNYPLSKANGLPASQTS